MSDLITVLGNAQNPGKSNFNININRYKILINEISR